MISECLDFHGFWRWLELELGFPNARPERVSNPAMNNDGSVSMSLRELLRLEEERVARERQMLAQRSEDDANARMAAERKARDAELAVLYAEQAQRKADADREREVGARLDGIARAAVERARLEAQDAALTAERSGQMRHAEALARLAQDGEKARLRRIIVALVVATLAVIGGFSALYVLKMRPEEEARRAATLAETRELADANARAQQKSREQQEKIEALRRDVEAQRVAPSPVPAAITVPKFPTPVGAHAGPARAVPTKRKDDGIFYATSCNGDPMCIEKK